MILFSDHPGPDRCNTVETIILPDLAPGNHQPEVLAANVPEPPQPFALAVVRPEPPTCAFETGYFKGIGKTYKTYAHRLEVQGITLLHQLFGRISQLADLPDISSGGVALIAGRLQLLQTIVSGSRPRDVAATLTLDQLFIR